LVRAEAAVTAAARICPKLGYRSRLLAFFIHDDTADCCSPIGPTNASFAA
jgi:hypothetical protein